MRKVSPQTVAKKINALKEELKDLERYENQSCTFSFTVGEDFNSWKEIEERLPQLTLIENSDNKVVLAGDDALSNHLFMLRLAIINGSNLTLTSDGKLVEVNTNPDTLAYVYKFYNINYSFSENKMTLEHFNP